MKRHARRQSDSRTRAYRCHEELTAAVRRGAHRLRIAQLHQRAMRAWREGAKLHRGRDAGWARVARWHLAALRHGVLDAGAPVPLRLPDGLDEPWPGVPHGAQWLYRAGLPHHWSGPATLLDGTVWHAPNGLYERIS